MFPTNVLISVCLHGKRISALYIILSLNKPFEPFKPYKYRNPDRHWDYIYPVSCALSGFCPSLDYWTFSVLCFFNAEHERN